MPNADDDKPLASIPVGEYAPDGAFADVPKHEKIARVPYMEKSEVKDLGNMIKVNCPILWAEFKREPWKDGERRYYRWRRVR